MSQFKRLCFCINDSKIIYEEFKLNKTPSITDLTKTNDIEKGIAHIRQKYPKAKIYALGYSMGSNLLLRYLKTNPDSIKAAVAISTPWRID